ncbi:MAG: bifunctional phosphopantothenoylcysteine decarboxylase/phosphopantothenate--cysteine ligase CoaBC [Erysipelotrichaceae bacterium]|nr:bifunctional phosphopantothenoylcysteine decarboxylase/phosphopantothenate--cysteine ligase CoaBC [Erysipelotrichaceae bacterium]
MKTVIVGITGGIAAYKSAQLVSDLMKKDLDVYVLMTEHAKEFIAPLTFASLTHHPVYGLFDTDQHGKIMHIELAKKADAFLIAPATANVIAKIVHGIADDMLTTTFLAATCPKLIAPAMNTHMYENPVTQNNLALCKQLGYRVIDSSTGLLACGDVGVGKLAELSDLMEEVEQALWSDHCLQGKRLVVTAGATQEALDPVRYLTNHSTGKMGFAIAKMAKRCGAEVTLIAAPNHLPPIKGVNYVPVVSALDMLEVVRTYQNQADIIVKAAAVADYRPKEVAQEKIKKETGTPEITLERNPDILKEISLNRPFPQVICGFAMETEHVMEHAKEKFEKKQVDFLVVNNLREEGAGFGVDSNRVSILSKDKVEDLKLMSKEEVGYELCKRFAKRLEEFSC